MLRSEPSNKTAIEVPINLVTECKNCPLPACSRDECSRNSVTASLSQRAHQGLTESVIVIPERPVPTMLNPLAQQRRVERLPRLQALELQLQINADVIQVDKLRKLKSDDGVSRQAKERMCDLPHRSFD